MHLTDTIVRKLPPPERGNRRTPDDTVKGFGVYVTAAGAKSFYLRYRRKSDQRERLLSIGSYPDWSTVAARDAAKRHKREIDAGADPVGEQQANRDAPTVAELAERFIAEHMPMKRPSTARDYLRRINADIIPALGHLKVHAVAFEDIEAMHCKISARGSPIAANRIAALTSVMFAKSIKFGWRDDNPVSGVERHHEHKRTRFLSESELRRLLGALHDCRDRNAADGIRLALLTGARRGELLSSRWRDIDFSAGVWRKPGPTTKTTEHIVPLSQAARALLLDMWQRAGSPGDDAWIFPASRGGGPRRDLGEHWERLRKAAGIPDVRLHDLRHTFASALASSGTSLRIIGGLLNHAQPGTTQRYAHLVDSALRDATEKASALIMGVTRTS